MKLTKKILSAVIAGVMMILCLSDLMVTLNIYNNTMSVSADEPVLVDYLYARCCSASSDDTMILENVVSGYDVDYSSLKVDENKYKFNTHNMDPRTVIDLGYYRVYAAIDDEIIDILTYDDILSASINVKPDKKYLYYRYKSSIFSSEYEMIDKQFDVEVTVGIKKNTDDYSIPDKIYDILNSNLKISMETVNEDFYFNKEGSWFSETYNNKTDIYDENISVGETKSYHSTVYVKDKLDAFKYPSNYDMKVTCTAEFRSLDISKSTETKVRLLSDNGNSGENTSGSGSESGENQNPSSGNVTKKETVLRKNVKAAKSNLEAKANAAVVYDPRIDQYLTVDQSKELKCVVYAWVANIYANLAEKYANDESMERKIKEKIYSKLGIDSKVIPGVTSIDATLRVKAETNKGERIIQFDITLHNYTLGRISYSGYGQLNSKVIKPGWFGDDCELDSTTGMVALYDMEAFVKQLQNIAESTIKGAYDKVYSDDINKFTEYVAHGTIVEVLKNEGFIKGSYSDNFYKLMKYSVKKSVESAVKCPVDVYVYDSNEDLVGKIINNEVIECIDEIELSVVGDEKYIKFSDDNYILKLVGNDSGTMDYEVKEYNDDQLSSKIQYDDLTLTDGIVYYAPVPDACDFPDYMYNPVDAEFNEINSSNVSLKSNLVYSINEGEVTITGYTGTSAYIDIPEFIEGLPVTTIGECAFSGLNKIIDVFIPSSVKTIGEGSFSRCNGLKNVTLSEGLETIGKNAFSECSSLEEITVPNSTVTIDSGAFEYCNGLKDIWIGDNVTSIGNYAFYLWSSSYVDNIGNFDEVSYKEEYGNAPKLHINSIASWCNINFGSSPLFGISDLYLGEDLITDLIIPDGVKKINAYAFREGSFETITLPESVEIIDKYAFSFMRNLERITIKNKNCEIESGSIFNDNHFIKGNERITCNNMNFTLYGYSDSTALSYALEHGCKFELLDRNSITIEPQNGVSEYDNRISWSLDSYGTLTISGAGGIYESPWREGNENKIRKVIIGDGITVIHNDAFKNCYELKEVILPDSIEEIDGEAFMSCVNLDNIALPQNLKRLGSSAFDNTAIIEKQITRFRYIGDWLVEIQKPKINYGLQDGDTYSITIPNDVIRIASSVVKGERMPDPDRVETITIPTNVKYLSGDSFWGCNSLKSITILNPNCKIDDIVGSRRGIICTEVFDGSSIQETQFKGTIYGYSGSTAERMAQKYGYAFSSLGESPYPLEPVEEEPQSQENIPSQYDPQNLCTISFNMQGHGGRIADSKIPKGARDLDLSSLTMLSAGYTFGGWYKDQNCTDGQEFTIPNEINESFTLYAKWIANKYKVSFNKNAEDAIGTMTDQTLTYDTAKNLTTNGFTRTGYTFKGWSKSNSATTADYTDGQSVNNLTEENNGTVNLYAVWKANTYTVKFNKNANDVTGEMANQSFTYDSTKNLAANVFTRTGYTFKGWAKSNSTTTADYTDRQSVNNLTDDNNGLVNLYAVWEANTYMITYVLNGGTNPDEAPVTYTYGIGATLPIPTKTGYTFNGWYSNGQFSGDAVTAISATESKNKVFNAKWTANTYTVKFNKNANDATGEMANQSFTYDSTKNLATNVFTRTGYAFLGWSKSNTATTATYTDKADVKNLAENGTVNLYAVWKEGSNNVTFNSKGGSNVISAIVINGGKVTKPDDPTRSGYTFGGWFTDDACTTEFDFDTEITESITLYAKWTANSSPVTYDTVTEGNITYHVHDSYAEVYECSTNVETATIKSSVSGVSVKRIGENAFNSCTKLKTVNIPASVTEIGTNAFWGCASLESLTIPKTVTTIGKDIFSHCDKFSKIYGYRNSAAERYATANSLTFVALDGEAVTTSSSTTTGSSATTTTTTTTTSANAAASTAAAPARPTNVVIDNSGVVTWDKAENAVEYKVFKKVGDNTSHSGWVKGTSYKFGSVPNEKFEIYVAARNSDGSKTSWSDHVNVTVAKPLGTPTNVSVYKNGKVTWTKAANATSYKVVTIVNGVSRGGDVVKTNSATIEVPATNYQVYVAAFGENGTKKISEKIDVTVENALGVVNDVTIDKDGNISWQVAENAVAYKVGKVVNGYTYYTDKLETTTAKIKPATKDYQVFVVAFDKDGKTSWGKKNLVEVGNLGTVLDPKVDKNGNVTWTAARNAVKYKVGKIVNGTTYYTGELTTNSATINVPESDYKVFVVAFDKDGNKTWGTKVDVR